MNAESITDICLIVQVAFTVILCGEVVLQVYSKYKDFMEKKITLREFNDSVSLVVGYFAIALFFVWVGLRFMV